MVVHFRAFYIGKSDIHLSIICNESIPLADISAELFLYLVHRFPKCTIHLSVDPIAHV